MKTKFPGFGPPKSTHFCLALAISSLLYLEYKAYKLYQPAFDDSFPANSLIISAPRFEFAALSGIGMLLYIGLWRLINAHNKAEFIAGQLTEELRRQSEILKSRQFLLEESELRFQSLADGLPILIWASDADRLCNWFNQGWLDFTGRSMRQEMGNGWAEGVHPDDLERCLSIYVNHFNLREPFSMEYRLRRKDGEYRWVHDKGVPRYDAEGCFLGFMGSCFDVTDRFEALSKLQESEQRWKFALEGAGDGVWDWDTQTNRVFLSHQWKAMLGYSDEEIGNSVEAWDTRVHPDDKAKCYQEIERCLTGQTSIYYSEHRLRCKDGGYKWILARAIIISRSEDGKHARFIGTHTDMTERINAELELEKARKSLELSESRLKGATKAAGLGLWMRDINTNMMSWDEGMFYIFGIPEQYTDQPMDFTEWKKRVYAEDISEIERLGRKLINGETGSPIVYRIILPDTSMRYVCSGAYLERDSQGRPSRLIGLCQDITYLRQTERLAKLYENLVWSSSDAIITRTVDGIITSWNHGAKVIFGYSAEEMLGKPIDVLLPPECLEDEVIILKKLAAGEMLRPFEARRICKDGRVIDVSITDSAIWDGNCQIIGSSKIARDISLANQAKKELEHSKKEAETASRAKSAFLANMSHEIRTPLNAIVVGLELIQREPLTELQRKYLNIVSSSAGQLCGIISDILDMSRIESGRVELDYAAVDLLVLIESIHQQFAAMASSKSLQLSLHVDAKLPQWVLVDAVRLKQVLNNLLSNALKFTAKGSINLSARLESAPEPNGPEAMRIVFTVSDTGIGISSEARARIFEPFMQAEASTIRNYGGTGLGLTICRQLVELMSGKIEVFSTQGEGSRFWFTIPVEMAGSEAIAKARREAAQYSEADKSACKRLAGLYILVADDMPANQVVLAELLRIEGARVELADNGLDAVKQVVNNGKGAYLDAVLMDTQMPIKDGYQAAQLIRGRYSHEQLPIIGLSANAFKDDREKALAAGMNAYLTKPVNISSLVVLLKTWCPKLQALPNIQEARNIFEFVDGIESVVELEQALENLGGNRAIYLKLINLFEERLPTLRQTLFQPLHAGDFYQLRRELHKLRGAALTLGLKELAELSHAGEQLEIGLNSPGEGVTVTEFEARMNAVLDKSLTALMRIKADWFD